MLIHKNEAWALVLSVLTEMGFARAFSARDGKQYPSSALFYVKFGENF